MVSLGLPYTAVSYYSSDASIRDFLIETDGKEFLNLDHFGNGSGTYLFEASARTGALDLMIDLNDWYFFFRQSLNSSMFFEAENEFIQWMWQGPATLPNGTYMFSPALNATLYNELSYGTGLNFGNIRVGGRINTIYGLSNISSSGSGFNINTSNGFVEGTADFSIQSSNMDDHGVDIFNPYENVIFSFDYFSENRGRSFDLGMSVDLFQNWIVSASVIGWKGEINWSHDLENYTARSDQLIENWSFDEKIQDYSTSISSKVEDAISLFRGRKNSDDYTTKLPWYAYMGVSYMYNEQWKFGMLWHQANYPVYTVSGVNAQAIYMVSPFFHVGANYNMIRGNRPDQIGISLTGQYKSFQIFGMLDNLFTTFNYKDHTNGGGRLGIALALD